MTEYEKLERDLVDASRQYAEGAITNTEYLNYICSKLPPGDVGAWLRGIE